MLRIDERELRTLFDDRTYRRGRSYARAGAVAQTREDGDRVRARVQGSRPRPYEVWVRRDGERIVSQCSCPGWSGARRHCHHVAALLFTLRAPPAGAAEEGGGSLRPPLSSWLAAQEAARPAAPAAYVFSVEDDHAIVRQLARAPVAAPDARLAELLAGFPRAEEGGARVPLARAGELLARLSGRPVFADDRCEIPLRFAGEPVGVRVDMLAPEAGGEPAAAAAPFLFRAVLAPRGGGRALSFAEVRVAGGAERFVLAEDVVHPLDPRLPDAMLARLRDAPEVSCRAEELPRAFAEWLPRLREAAGAVVPEAAAVFPVQGGPPRILAACAGDLERAEVRLFARYGEVEVAIDPEGAAPAAEVRLDPERRPFVLARDLAAEEAAAALLPAAGLRREEGAFFAEGEAALAFWSRGRQAFPEGWDLRLPPALVSLRVRQARIQPRIEVGLGARGWFSIDAFLGAEGVAVDPDELRACLAALSPYATLADGSVAPIDAAACRDVLDALSGVTSLEGAPRGEAPPWLAGPVRELAAAGRGGAHVSREAAELLCRLSGEAVPEAPVPAGLTGALRPYQVHGFRWLAMLEDLGLPALLADEMGLGKTIQTLALLLRDQERGAGPALVVCPTSVLPNWLREAGRFAPSLRAVAFAGGRRKLPEEGAADLVVTSYAILRRDASLLGSRAFSSVVLDEAQHVKNPEAKGAQAARGLTGRFRLVLTGTPVENRPLDLWSLFSFLLPGFLGGQDEFVRRYEEGAGSTIEEAQRRLAVRVGPFLLRRVKKDVLEELPEKRRTDMVCELSEPQRRLYRELLMQVRAEVFGAIALRGMARARVNILTGLLRLRQVACDPRLLFAGEFSEEDSGKLQLFRELIEEALDGGHRVVVFSQFVQMLALQKKLLDGLGVRYEYLDGRTRDRQAILDRFNAPEGEGRADVFLISLRAGGTGVNLASADTVLLYDPWWNPAVEDQAVDRVHRIGQRRGVAVYRLVARDTVEEKMLALAEKKRGVSERLLAGRGGGAFSAEELVGLLGEG